MDIVWSRIDEFPNYLVSNFGDVMNETTGRILYQSTTIQGAVKVNLIKDGRVYSRSVKVLVAKSFVERIDLGHVLFDTPIHLDGNQQNNRADNLMWRPRWFAWKYTRQFSKISNLYYKGPIRDVKTREIYLHIYEAAVLNGLLFKDIWRSILLTSPPSPTFPTGQIFEFVR